MARHRTTSSPSTRRGSRASHGSRSKSLSQNFLHAPGALHAIVRAAEVGPGDLVLEPGAGPGTLTRVLARDGRRVVAYELDPGLASRLPGRLRPLRDVRVVAGDFLRARPPHEPFAVVGNIPFARTTAIVRWCLAAPTLTSATLLTQREYARRRAGDYGRWTRLTVLSWPEFDWRLGPRVARDLFTPVPRTDAAVLRLVRRPAPLLPAPHLPAFRALVAEGYTGTGGSIGATLGHGRRTGRVRAALREAQVPPDAPVGAVTPPQWLALFRRLAS